MSILIAEKSKEALKAAVLIRGRLYAFKSEEDSPQYRENAIMAGITERAMPGIHAVFVRLPGNQTGFLPVSPERALPCSGTKLTVQIRHPATRTKKAMLTDEISLPGQMLVYLPYGQGIAVSKRLNPDEKKELLARTADIHLPEKGGFILRASSLVCKPSDITAEAHELEERWKSIYRASTSSPDIRLLWPGEDIISTLIREEKERLEYILTNAPELFPDTVPCPVKYCEHPFIIYNIPHLLDRSLRRCFQMKSGATLIIDSCEAMTVIDVNSASASGKKYTPEEINSEAVGEIARLLRLRGIGGMILIDFIDMKEEKNRMKLMDTMEEILKEDPVKTTVHDITALGLMELTRKRETIELRAASCAPCPYCGGTGISCMPASEEDNSL